jgi:hypothetical protein
MDGWLDAFASLGLIAPPHGSLRILRHPTRDKIAAAACTPDRTY